MAGDRSELTPIHIRGKRNAHLRAKKLRQQICSQAPTEPIPSQSPIKKQKVVLSRLEDLPTELLEVIFVYSGNVDLPLTSKGLLAQLSGHRLHKQILDVTLRPMLEADKASEAQILQVEAVTPRRFCTWHLFQSCFPDVAKPALQRFLRVPSKLLHGPWTADKVAFLRWHLPGAGAWLDVTEKLRMESFDGVLDAVKEQSLPALQALCDFGCVVPLQILHSAVIEYGCNKEIVSMLLDPFETDALDSLDPVLWAWSTESAQIENGKGAWLQEMLTEHSNEMDYLRPQMF